MGRGNHKRIMEKSFGKGSVVKVFAEQASKSNFRDPTLVNKVGGKRVYLKC